MTSAEIALDSISPEGHRLTTMIVTMHRFVLAELNTHRVFSRNSASSRAIPVAKQIERVMTDPAIPVSFPAEQRGMQGGEELSPYLANGAKSIWLDAKAQAVIHARRLTEMGVHKSVVNRLLEPFMWHTVIITATEWDGFWHQRCSSLAQPEIRVAAEMMWDAYHDSTPTLLQPGEWHTPLIQPDEVDPEDGSFFAEVRPVEYGLEDLYPDERSLELRKRVSVARCARVSYLTHDGRRDPSDDLTLYERLVNASPMHASPLEHVATPCGGHDDGIVGYRHLPPHLGNFVGWDQMRHDIEDAR